MTELISKFCPDGVPHLPLAVVGSITRGKRFVKSDMIESGTPCIHYGEIYTKYNIAATASHSFVSPELASRLRTANYGDVIMVSAGETVEDIGKAVAWLGVEPVVIHDACYAFRSDLNPKFVSYFFHTDQFRDQIRMSIASSKVSSISTTSLGKALIPVPPKSVQDEIVRILDSFTQLEAELEAELEARKKQYEFYRNQLLTFPEKGGVRWVRMGEFATLVRGNGMPKTDFSQNGVPAIHYGQIYTHYGTAATRTISFVGAETASKLAKVEPGDIVITNTSENIEDVGKAVAWLGDETAVTGGHATVIKHQENPQYLAYYFQTHEFALAKKKWATGTKVIDVSAKNLAKIEIPLPSRADQDRIAALLKNFELLVSDISIGLPAELAARRKQYAYYRNKLLTFREKEA